MRVAKYLSILIFICSPHAFAITGEELLNGLRDADNPRLNRSFYAGLSLGFVSGVGHSTVTNYGTCQNTNLTLEQLGAIVRVHLEKRPQDWHLPAEPLVKEALKNAFPCLKGTK